MFEYLRGSNTLKNKVPRDIAGSAIEKLRFSFYGIAKCKAYMLHKKPKKLHTIRPMQLWFVSFVDR